MPSATIRYDRKIVRSALNQYILHRLGKLTFVVMGGLMAWLLYEALSDQWDMIRTGISGAVFGCVLLVLLAYYVRWKTSMGFFKRVKEPVVEMTFSDDGVCSESELARSEIKWTTFDELLTFPDVWLLVYAKSGYITLPLDQLPTECRDVIRQKLESVDESSK